MKKVCILLPLLFAGAVASAQLSYNTVTATITDPTGNPYANAGYSISLVDSHGFRVSSASTPNGQLFNAQTVSGTLDAAGHFSARLVPNNILGKPSGTQWKFAITAPTDASILLYQPAWAINYQTPITGNVDLSSQISANAQTVQFANLRTGQTTLNPSLPGGWGILAELPVAGMQRCAIAPYKATITGWTILSKPSGSAQFDVTKGSYSDAGLPATSIVAAAPPVLSSAQKSTSVALTGWTTSIVAGTNPDVVCFSITSTTAFEWLELVLKVARQ